jgi:hypothetical protein
VPPSRCIDDRSQHNLQTHMQNILKVIEKAASEMEKR